MNAKPKQHRYVLIEKQLNIVWGEVLAADPIEACRKCDEMLETFGRNYLAVDADDHKRDNLTCAYAVHQVPEGMEWFGVDDDHDEGEILLVKSLPLVAHVHVEEPR